MTSLKEYEKQIEKLEKKKLEENKKRRDESSRPASPASLTSELTRPRRPSDADQPNSKPFVRSTSSLGSFGALVQEIHRKHPPKVVPGEATGLSSSAPSPSSGRTSPVVSAIDAKNPRSSILRTASSKTEPVTAAKKSLQFNLDQNAVFEYEADWSGDESDDSQSSDSDDADDSVGRHACCSMSLRPSSKRRHGHRRRRSGAACPAMRRPTRPQPPWQTRASRWAHRHRQPSSR
eukprot:TRINITY_DN4633_c0_g2_i1.p1 TRINITY_DN4633_c0_g2~~TRINITY_DN4633_c0_g2_i1.p1  ORF type:complete len:234 (-),score=46.66 TRINITY_DN4633_c0_g2_i1:204-905(-)